MVQGAQNSAWHTIGLCKQGLSSLTLRSAQRYLLPPPPTYPLPKAAFQFVSYAQASLHYTGKFSFIDMKGLITT